MVCVIGFSNQMSEEDIIGQLHQKFLSYGEVLNIFRPKISTTSLGFAYIYIKLNEDLKPDELYEPFTMDGAEVYVRVATPKQCYHAEMEGRTTVLGKGSDDQKTTLKKVCLPTHANVVPTELTFCWEDKRPDIIDEPYEQEENDCWSVALCREYNALLALTRSKRPKLTPDELSRLVDPGSIVSGRGIDSIKYAVSAMKKLVKEMNIFRRPRGDNVAKHEEFEKLQKDLLATSPVMVTLDHLPSFGLFNGNGVFRPAEVDLYTRTYEKFIMHCLLLIGYGMKDGVEYWIVQDSNGDNWGRNGILMLERHKCLIKYVVELKL